MKNTITVPTHWIRDPRLSRRARCLLVELLSYNLSKESVSVETLMANGREGRDAIRKALLELEQVGYLTRDRVKQGSLFTGVRYTVQEPVA